MHAGAHHLCLSIAWMIFRPHRPALETLDTARTIGHFSSYEPLTRQSRMVALAGPHARISTGHGLARRYPRDMAPSGRWCSIRQVPSHLGTMGLFECFP